MTSVFSLSLSTFVEMSAPTAQFSLRTLTLTLCTWTAGLATQEVVNLTDSLGEYITKTTLVITVQVTPLFAAPRQRSRLHSSGLEVLRCQAFMLALTFIVEIVKIRPM